MTKRKKTFAPSKIVSGGQTGVDRGALDAAIALGLEHGGWCPAGRLSEDGTIPSRYSLTEMESADYPARTKQNVIDSDATLIIYEKKIKGGTLLTKRICKSEHAPHVLIRLDQENLDDAVKDSRTWIKEIRPKTLNIAGPRESNYPGIQDRSCEFLLRVFAS